MTPDDQTPKLWCYRVEQTRSIDLWVWGTEASTKEDAEEMALDALNGVLPDDTDIWPHRKPGTPEPHEMVWTGGPDGTDLRYDDPKAPWRTS